jgi:hypothetical protein
MVESAVTGYSNEIDPAGKEPAQSEHMEITASQVQVTEKKNIKLTDDETGTPLEKMSDSQIAQIKRYDCRLRKKVIPHDYKKPEPVTDKKIIHSKFIMLWRNTEYSKQKTATCYASAPFIAVLHSMSQFFYLDTFTPSLFQIKVT